MIIITIAVGETQGNRCVAQFGRALRSGRRGRRFKSCRIDSDQLNNDAWLSLVEHYVRDVGVAGSNPVASTAEMDDFSVIHFLFRFSRSYMKLCRSVYSCIRSQLRKLYLNSRRCMEYVLFYPLSNLIHQYVARSGHTASHNDCFGV